MGKDRNIVHEYYKKTTEEYIILVRLNPLNFEGWEITRFPDGEMESRQLQFDESIYEDFKADDFVAASPLEFNLYAAGLV